MTNSSFPTTQLDFENIKSELKTYLAQQDEFTDYDFEASGLSNILDVLAYNTTFNALLANFGLNEAYLKSAQLRSSVVNIAQTLGYNIRSRTASVAYANLSLNLQGAGSFPDSITLPIGTKFTTSVDGISYTFQTRAVYTATNDGTGVYTFYTDSGSEDIPIYEGTIRTKTFIVGESDERQIFVIPDETIDTSQMSVKVYDAYASSEFTLYTNIASAVSLSASSTTYRISEAPNGYYEIGFGDGSTTGTKPVAGNKVEVEYLSTSGPVANGAASFTPVSQITVNSVDYTLNTTLSAVSTSGANRQTVESIRENAPLSFAAQRRLVTPEDYKTTILSTFSNVDDVSVWGGEDNVPAKYGVVYISLLFDDGVSAAAQQSVKGYITSTLNENLGVLSIDVEFVDPVAMYLNFTTEFDYTPALTSLSKSTLESQVLSLISTHVSTNLSSFSKTFRKSVLLTDIDEYSDAILSSKASVTMQYRLTTTSGVTSYSIDYPTILAEPDDENYTITSSSFYYGDNDEICTIRNKLSSTVLQIVTSAGTVLVDNVGSYNAQTGVISLSGFAPGAPVSGDAYIKINAKPLNDSTIKSLRNYYFSYDSQTSTTSGIVNE